MDPLRKVEAAQDYMKSFDACNRLSKKIRLTFHQEIQRKANDGSQKSSYRTQRPRESYIC